MDFFGSFKVPALTTQQWVAIAVGVAVLWWWWSCHYEGFMPQQQTLSGSKFVVEENYDIQQQAPVVSEESGPAPFDDLEIHDTLAQVTMEESA